MLRLDRDALHIYAGVAGMLLTALVTRSPLHRWRVLLPLLMLAAANEAVYLASDYWAGLERARQWGESVRDMVNTMALPMLLVLIARRVSAGSAGAAPRGG